MSGAFSKTELRVIVELCDGGVQHPRLSSPAVHVVQALRDKAARLMAEAVSERALGAKVYELRLPLSTKATVPGKPARAARGKIPARAATQAREVTHHLAPTLNTYGSMQPWQRAQLYKVLDVRIMAEMARWPACLLRGQPRARGVRVTRFSSSMPDEITVDVLGGKVPIDRMVHAGILAGDTHAILQREAHWKSAPPGGGALLVEVFELAP